MKYATDITASMDARTRAVSAAENTLSNVEAVAGAAEAMNASVSDIVTNMAHSKRAVAEINAQTAAVDRATSRMRDAAQSMDGVVQLIAQVAKETNMLALNATIESARAGESGRGFAVVAQEVKNLAAQTGTATNRISTEIAAMQNVASEVVMTLATITSAIRDVQGLVDNATAAIDAQSTITSEIAGNMHTAAEDVASIGRTLDEWIMGMEERRFDERQRVVKSATIFLDQGAAVTCSLRNISRSGAKLVMENPSSVPARFSLEIAGEGRRRTCEVVRRGGNEVSVRFRETLAA